MASMIALLDEVDDLEVGKVLPLDRYLTDDGELWRLGHGGTLYLVAPGPKNAVFLVAALEQPERSRLLKGDTRPEGWYAAENTVPITDVSKLRRSLRLGAKGDLEEKLANALEVSRKAEQQLRALFDDEDAPVISATPAEASLVARIDELLEIWRRTRSTEVADLIDRATRLLPRFDRPLLLDTRDDRDSHARWMKAWNDERGEAMPQLMRCLVSLGARLSKRIEALAAVPDDPRIARALARNILSGTRDWVPIIERSRDATAWNAIAGVSSELDFVAWGFRKALAFTSTSPRAVELGATDLARVRAIEAALVPDPTEGALVDAIAEHPAKDAPYLIYSDWLLERGHPRGEYIALACQKRRGKLSSALARRLAALERLPYLFGPLDDVATTWQRPRPWGIDRTLDVYGSPLALTWLEVAPHPLVRALESLRFIGVPLESRLSGIAAFARAAPRLRRIAGLSPAIGDELAKALGPAWRRDGGSVVRG